IREIYVKSSHEHIKVLVKDIYSISSDSDYTEIQLKNKKILSNEPLRHWVDVLGGGDFAKCTSHISSTPKRSTGFPETRYCSWMGRRFPWAVPIRTIS